MKKTELSQSFKGFSKIEALKRVSINNNQLMFYSEPSSANGTPTSSNIKKLKLESVTKDLFLAKKPTIDLLSHEPASSNKTNSFIIKNSSKIAPKFRRESSDSDSDVDTPTGAEQKSYRRSKFARSKFSDADEQKQTDDTTNATTSKSLTTNETSAESKEEMTFSTRVKSSTSNILANKFVIKSQNSTLTPTELKENKLFSTFKPDDSTNKAKDSPFHRKGFIPTNKPSNFDCNSDSEAKKARPSRDGPVMPYRWLYFAPNFNIEKFKKHLLMIYKGLVYSTKSLKSPTDKFISSKQVIVPDPLTKKLKTLILDLDETLIHCCSLKENPDVILQSNNLGEVMKIPIKIRPYLRDFFNKVSPVYEIIIFTASSAPYAKTIVSHIDPERKFINFLLTREHCMETKNGFFIKDLRILKNRDLKDMIIVDNLVHSFGFQIENGVPILEFLNDPTDMELRYLADYLLKGHHISDLRDYNRENLRLIEMSHRRFEDIEGEFKY